MDTQREVQFEGLEFPIWAVVNRDTRGLHCLTSPDGETDLPLFRQEAYARTYIAHRKLTEEEPGQVANVLDLLALLDRFQSEGGDNVRFDDAYGPTPGTICYGVGEFTRFIRDQLAEG